MCVQDQYEPLDFGENRRLERFDKIILDRYCPSANFPKTSSMFWQQADAIFIIDQKTSSNLSAERGFWLPKTDFGKKFLTDSVEHLVETDWKITTLNGFSFELRSTPFGHIGLFPEQRENWNTIQNLCRKISQSFLPQQVSLKVLNLFAYTGGSTMAAALGNAEVTHVDAAKNIVVWAIKNAEISQIPQNFIRWIVEDAQKFVRRELKRENKYHGVILDPPSYGHGTHGEIWRLSKYLPELLTDCFSLLDFERACFILLTCHTPNFSIQRLLELFKSIAQKCCTTQRSAQKITFTANTMVLRAKSGQSLSLGESVLFVYDPVP
ncbi:MAG: class I SAM-dependent methyltransferase [Planctomycetaceae bacterium]|jgi:23S rRNA (cytosine1962-C5)-methyltransferase|nr:class I SAM-dependent methyltransferase [Planctomycetaceae bacterium]